MGISISNTNIVLTSVNNTTLQVLFEHSAVQYADCTAIIFGDQKFTYQYINKASNQLATLLIEKGVKLEDRVGIAVDRSVEMVIVLLAILKAGAAYVPIDPEYPKERITYMLEDSSASMLITNTKYKGAFKTSATKILIEEVWPLLNNYADHYPKTDVSGQNLAYIIYTSGSTGLPKGVQIEHHSLVNLLLSMKKFPGMNHHDKLMAVTTISFDIAGLELFLPLITGAELIIVDLRTAKDGHALLDVIKNKRCTMIQATPSTYKMLLEAGWQDRFDLKVLCGGEPMSKDLANKILPKCTALYNMYGPTETTIYSTGKQIKATDEVITIGSPIDNTSIYLINEKFQTVTDGGVGEIYIGGEGVARGYFNKPELTKELFLDDPFSIYPQDKLYRTGDLGRILTNGEIECLGRIDHQVKIRGYRIELGEIEQVLKTQANVKDCLVTTYKNKLDDARLVAYVIVTLTVTDLEKPIVIEKWKSQLQNKLPQFMVPTYFVVLNEFPLTENGKINRKILPAPGFERAQKKYTAPKTINEVLIANIWAEYLGVEAVGSDDNFFALGGHSIIAVQIIGRIEKETAIRLPLGCLFEYPTVSKMAELLKVDHRSQVFGSLVALKPDGNKVPLYLIHGIGATVFKFNGFAHQLDKEQPVYGLQAKGINGLEEPLESIKAIAEQYITEILRTNPEGPYALGGYSFGGIVALEMAQQLKAMGKIVTLLAMIDSYVTKNNQLDRGALKDLHKVYTRIRKFIFGFYLLKTFPIRTIQYKVETIRRLVTGKGNRKMFGEDDKDGKFEYINKVADALKKANANYHISYYDGTIHVFKCTRPSFYIDDFKYLGWKNLAKKVFVKKIKGEHTEVFDHPYNIEFARIMQQTLNEATKDL